jgi:hypothetical protein
MHSRHPHRLFILAMATAALALVPTACAPAAQTADTDWAVSGEIAEPVDHRVWDALLQRYVNPSADGVNRVDYAALRQNDRETLRRYLDGMQAINITQYPRDEQFAYWVNLYNAATVDVIIENYPLGSIRDIGLIGQGPWKDKVLTVAGKRLSLDDIEHGILRPIWKDVRIHYAVNCASIGCPNLAPRAYTGANLEAMLEEAATGYVNHPRGFARIEGKLVASSIYDWYSSDWGEQSDVLQHARQYATPETREVLGQASAIDGFDYNWSLNEQK